MIFVYQLTQTIIYYENGVHNTNIFLLISFFFAMSKTVRSGNMKLAQPFLSLIFRSTDLFYYYYI